MMVLQHPIDEPNADSQLFTGRFEILGIIDSNLVGKISEIARSAGGGRHERVSPSSFFTVGYDDDGRRFGDLHAIVSRLPSAVQVCAFLAVGTQIDPQRADQLFDSLRTQQPLFVQ